MKRRYLPPHFSSRCFSERALSRHCCASRAPVVRPLLWALAGFVADNEMVMAVESNGEAVAYPIRQMAYHHVVQDVVGAVPIVATY